MTTVKFYESAIPYLDEIMDWFASTFGFMINRQMAVIFVIHTMDKSDTEEFQRQLPVQGLKKRTCRVGEFYQRKLMNFAKAHKTYVRDSTSLLSALIIYRGLTLPYKRYGKLQNTSKNPFKESIYLRRPFSTMMDSTIG